MGLLVLVATVAVAALLVTGKLLTLFGFVAACASFSFPLGLIGMVGIGVLLTVLLAPRGSTDRW